MEVLQTCLEHASAIGSAIDEIGSLERIGREVVSSGIGRSMYFSLRAITP